AGCGKRAAESNSSGNSDTPSKPEPQPTVANPPNNPDKPNPNVAKLPALPPLPLNLRRENRQPVDDKYPLPQDKVKATQLRNERLTFYKKATVEVFNQSAGANAPWADAARKAMGAYCLRVTRNYVPSCGVEHQDFLEAVKATMETKCDD